MTYMGKISHSQNIALVKLLGSDLPACERQVARPQTDPRLCPAGFGKTTLVQ